MMAAGLIRKQKRAWMADLEEVTRLPTDFDGIVRLFPLPELVLFPHALQPLHIFEPRYCDMLLECLASDRLIAMATLTSGVGDLLSNRPQIADTICIGKVVSHAETEDGRHNILLVGAKRARVIRELPTNRSFRMAEVEVRPDLLQPTEPQQRKILRAALLDAFALAIPPSANVQQNLHELMAGQMGLGPITDIIAYTLGLSRDAKLHLLAEVDVDVRANALIVMLKQFSLGNLSGNPFSVTQKNLSKDFPPPFSVN